MRRRDPRNESIPQVISILKRRISEVFSNDEAVSIFATLGPVQPTNATVQSLGILGTEKAIGLFSAFAADCDCSRASDWCSGIQVCKEGNGCTVDDTYPMCGTLWLYECDGVCGIVSDCGCIRGDL